LIVKKKSWNIGRKTLAARRSSVCRRISTFCKSHKGILLLVHPEIINEQDVPEAIQF